MAGTILKDNWGTPRGTVGTEGWSFFEDSQILLVNMLCLYWISCRDLFSSVFGLSLFRTFKLSGSRLHYVILFILFPKKTFNSYFYTWERIILPEKSGRTTNANKWQDPNPSVGFMSWYFWWRSGSWIRDDHKWSIYAMYTHRKTYICGTSMYIYTDTSHVNTYIYIYTYNIYLVGRRQTYTYIRDVDIYIYMHGTCIYNFIYTYINIYIYIFIYSIYIQIYIYICIHIYIYSHIYIHILSDF